MNAEVQISTPQAVEVITLTAVMLALSAGHDLTIVLLGETHG